MIDIKDELTPFTIYGILPLYLKKEKTLSMHKEISRLKSVDLREIWPTESQHFTPWLAEEESLSFLARTLNMEFELEAQERDIGDFFADLVCRNTVDDSRVLIENQLTQTDHTHLGQILTYAAGLEVATIIWIAERFRDEHRAALDWLNRSTGEDLRFFGVEIELWQIGDSLSAPKFNIVSKPNEHIPRVIRPSKNVQYWSRLDEHLRQVNRPFTKSGRRITDAWIFFSIGRSGFRLKASFSELRRHLRVVLDLFNPNDKKNYFEQLKAQREDIDPHFDKQLKWEEGFTRVALYKNNTNPMDEADWQNQHEWFAQKLEKFDKVFRPLIPALDASDEQIHAFDDSLLTPALDASEGQPEDDETDQDE